MLYIEVVGVVLFGIAGICSVFSRFRPAKLSNAPGASVFESSPACLEPDLRRLAAAVNTANQPETISRGEQASAAASVER